LGLGGGENAMTDGATTTLERPAPPEAAAPLLEVRGLTKRFNVGGLFSKRQVHALEDVSFTLNSGEVVALVGESGSGKSTIARVVARLTPPTSGEVRFRGIDVIKSESRGASLAYRGDVQMIFQDPFGSLNPVQTIGHHLERPLRLHHKASGRDAQAKIEQLLSTVGLNPPAEFATKYPHELSGGQRQRVSFARALAVEPKLMLADEPISMLDVSIRIGIMNLMERLKTELGLSYLYITHDIASARYIGDRTMVMYAGRMVESAESDKLIQQPAHPYTQRLLSAVPNPKAGAKTAVGHKRWEPPRLVNPPPGCPFAPQCPRVMDVCRQIMPGQETIAPGHWVRCHLYGVGGAPIAPG
jgi:peptide/nickel transport system ATP-binding protein